MLTTFSVRIGCRDARRDSGRVAVGAVAAAMSILLLAWSSLVMSPSASAAEAPVPLGTAASYSVLGGQTVTNTGATTLSGDVGVSPGTAIAGFPPGVAAGATHAADAPAAGAQADLVIAYDNASSRAPTASVAGDLVGRTLTSGVYNSTGPLALSGTLTLDGQGDPNAVFIFQIASSLTTASASSVSLINNAQPCNVFWQVGTSATLGTASSFAGTIMALTSVAATTSTVVAGRALARNGEVTLDTNVFTAADCAVVPIPAPTPATPPLVPAAAPPAPPAVPELANTGPGPSLAPTVALAALLLGVGGLMAARARRSGSRKP